MFGWQAIEMSLKTLQDGKLHSHQMAIDGENEKRNHDRFTNNCVSLRNIINLYVTYC